jgi:NTE family protein
MSDDDVEVTVVKIQMNQNGDRFLSRMLKAAICSLGLCLATTDLVGQTVNESAPARPAVTTKDQRFHLVPANRQSIGLALEGGGALGLAHVGVLKWMEAHHIPVDRVAGTSMGALIGSLAASGYSSEQIERIASNGNLDDLFSLKPALSHVSFRRREDRDSLPQALSFGLRNGKVSLGNALITDTQLNAFLAHELLAYNGEKLSFDDLPIPFRCVATDLTTLRPAVFGSGSLPFAVRASISIPGVFPPISNHGSLFVDGAIVDNLPTDVLRKELHADVVIAVHLSDAPFQAKDATSLLGIFARAFQAGTNRNEEISRSLADIEILPSVSGFSPTDYSKASALVRAGYEATERQRDKLLPYALSDDDWISYQAELLARRRPTPGNIKVVHVDGPDAQISAKIGQKAEKLVNQPFEASSAEALVSDVRGAGALDAYYGTFHTPYTAEQGLPKTSTPDDGIVLHWEPKVEGPPYLMLGADVIAVSSNVTSTIFDMRFLDENFGGYGSELRADARLGYLTALDTEYYRPIGNRGLFVQPHAHLLRQPVYMWVGQKRVSERSVQRAGGGLDVGVTFNRNFQTAVEYRASTIHWNLKEGVDDSPTQHLSGMVDSIAVHTAFSNRTAEIASPHGSQVDLTVGHLIHATDSRDAPFLILDAKQSFSFAQNNVFNISADANTYFRNNIADPLRFTLGGPLHLYASSLDEYRGTDTVLVRAIYLRRVAKLPTGLGQGIYLTTGYEAGSIWSPEQHSILRQDAVGGILLNTPLGAITIGGALGDAGRRKVFFTFGKLFQ